MLEWLNAQVASGYVEFVDGAYRLPEEQALALAVEDSPVYIAGGAGVLAALFLDKDKQVAAMRGDGAISWGEHHPCLFDGTERFFRPGYKANLVSTWLPALDGVTAKLEAGARVADVGCGHGASTVLMAEAYPDVTLRRLRLPRPLDRCSPRAGHRGRRRGPRHVHAGGRQRATRRRGSTSSASSTASTTWVTRSARPATPIEALADDGTVLLVEPFAGDRLEDNCNPVGRMFYAASTFICTPNSLSQDVGRGARRPGRRSRLRDVFTEAGFTTFRRATETPFNLILEARR